MNKFEIARWTKNLNVKLFLSENHDDLILILLYLVEENEFLALMAEVQTAIDKEAEDISVITAEKQLVKFDMGHFLFDLSLRASVEAHQLHMNELSLALDRPLSYFTDASDTDASTRAHETIALLSNPALTSILPADIVTAHAKETAYNAIKILPKHEIKLKKSETTAIIPEKLNLIDESENRIGKLIYSYRKNLINAWEEVIKVGEPVGVRHISLVFKLTDHTTGVPLPKVKVTLTNGITTITRYSSKIGWARFYSLETGNWSAQIEYETYHSQSKTDIGIEEDKIVKFDIKLEKTTPTTPTEETPTQETPTPPDSPTPETPSEPTPPTE
ncbi:MAG: carboxypeptidase-like regulatory domain-containing protein [Bacteroidota bacterium]